MLTLFTTPKPFHGHIGTIQRNAIVSWTHLIPRPEIILFGNEEGTAQIAQEFGVVHVPSILCNEFGTPRVDGLFNAAHQLATQPILCYINADIILMNDFIRAIEQVVKKKKRFLVVGRRTDFDVTIPLEFGPHWEDVLRTQIKSAGKIHAETGIDYFVFSPNFWGTIPPFAIGRTSWDNWLLYRACTRHATLIDATQLVLAVHQNHNYRHHPDGEKGVWEGPEAKYNRELIGDPSHTFTINDAPHILTKTGLHRKLSLKDLQRYLYMLTVIDPSLGPLLRFPIKFIQVMIRISE